jgi:hypothetical protein
MDRQYLIDEEGHSQFKIIYILHGFFLEISLILKLAALIMLLVGQSEEYFGLMTILYNTSSMFLYLTYSMDWLKFTSVRMHMQLFGTHLNVDQYIKQKRNITKRYGIFTGVAALFNFMIIFIDAGYGFEGPVISYLFLALFTLLLCFIYAGHQMMKQKTDDILYKNFAASKRSLLTALILLSIALCFMTIRYFIELV